MNVRSVINAIVRAEKPVVAVALLATLASGVAVWRCGLREDYRLEAFVATSDDSYARFRAFMEEFTSNEFALLAIHSQEPYGPPAEAVLREAVERLRAVPEVGRAAALTDIPAFLRATAGDWLLNHPLLSGTLISADRRTVAVLCRMEGERGDGPERREAVAAMRAIVDDLRGTHPDRQFVLAGPYVTLIDMYAYVERDLLVFSVLAFVLVVITLGIVFRQTAPMVYAGMTAACAILFTLGLTIALGLVVSLITQMLVILIIVLAVANCVHLASAAGESARLLPAAGRQERFRDTLTHVLAPCTAVMLATMAGFGSVCISDVAPVRRFGALMVVGLVVALVVAVAGVGWLHSRREPVTDAGGMGRWLRRCAAVALRHRLVCTLIFGLITAVSVPGWWRLRFESDFVKNFRADSEVRRSYRFIEENLSPLGSVEIIVRRHDGQPVATAEAVNAAHALGQTAMRDDPAVRAAASLHDLLTLLLPGKLSGDADVNTRLAMLRLWPDGQDLRRNFLNDAGDALRINLRCVEGVDVGEKLRMCADLERKAKERFGSAYNVEVTGLYRFYAGLVAGLLKDQYDSLAITILAVAGVIALMLRSLRWMLLVMAVNLLPVAVCLGAMGWLQIPVNMATAMMLGATQGLAVEDALHYVWRVPREYASSGSMPAALLRAHARVGRACVFTTVVVAGGFSILLLSEFLPTAYFGGLVGFTLCVALVANLVLLPILIDVFHPEKKRINRPVQFPASRAES